MLKDLVSGNDASCDPSLAALGCCFSVLQRALIDHELASMKSFSALACPIPAAADVAAAADQADAAPSPAPGGASRATQRLVMDAQTMRNLEILSTADGRKKGSLLDYVDSCKTPFGKRLLREWVASPLYRIPDIEERLRRVDAAIESLAHEGVDKARFAFGKLPDLERLTLRLHSMGLSREVGKRSGGGAAGGEHPDARALRLGRLQQEKGENARGCAQGTQERIRALGQLRGAISESAVDLRALLNPPSIDDAVDAFYAAYDLNEAASKGAFVPREGFVPRYDDAKARLAELKRSMNKELDDAKRAMGNASLKFWHPAQGKICTKSRRSGAEAPRRALGLAHGDQKGREAIPHARHQVAAERAGARRDRLRKRIRRGDRGRVSQVRLGR